MPQFVTKSYEQLLTQMIAQVVAQSGLSDISDTSVDKHILAAAARQDDEIYYQISLLLKLFSIDSATGEDLDERAKDIQPAVITRYPSAKATGHVVFSRSGTAGTVNIDVGTKVKTSSGEAFVTTAAGSITPASPEQIVGHGVGRDSGLVPVTASVGGVDGNVIVGAIIKFDAKPTGVDEVTNLTATAHGLDEEKDDPFRARLKAYIASLPRSTVVALENAVLGAEHPDTGAQIKFSHAVEDQVDRGKVLLYVDDGSGSIETRDTVAGEVVIAAALGGEVSLSLDHIAVVDGTYQIESDTRGILAEGPAVGGGEYVINLGTGQLVFDPPLSALEEITADYEHYTGLIEIAQRIVDGDPNDRENYPGYRAAGTYVRVISPQVAIQNVELTLWLEEGYTLADIESDVKQVVTDYINALGISGDVLRNEIIARVMVVGGVANLSLITPLSDVLILDNQLARTTTSNIVVA